MGDCDQGVRALAAGMGWADQLEMMIASGHAAFDAEGGVAAAEGGGGSNAAAAAGVDMTELAAAIEGASIK